ncbi:MAG: helix-turn-helix transcriptional regulator [Saprospiraceae bacterium]|nr:helix-turn-helix transcriptional regulator [Saprospiraceae bacterium]
MKLTTIDELTDEIIGKKGSPERNTFEYDLKMDIIGTIIKETRLKQKMSQADLASKLGVQKAQISKLENNTKDFRIGTIIKALDALGASLKLSVTVR